MIDGLWLRFGLNQDGLDLAAANRQMDAILDFYLGPKMKTARRKSA